MTEFITERLTDAESAVDSLTDSMTGDGDDGLFGSDEDESTDGPVDSVIEDVRAIVTIVREAEDILESIDVSELPEAVDAEQVREAIEAGEIPDALADE